MADILATLFRFRLFVFEYGPLFLAAWLGLAVATGLIAAVESKRFIPEMPGNAAFRLKNLAWLRRLVYLMLWRPAGKAPILSPRSGLFLFSLAASAPSLAVTSLLGLEIVWLRLVLAVLYALFLNWFISKVVSHRRRDDGEHGAKADSSFRAGLVSDDSPSPAPRGRWTLARVIWRSFIGQLEGAIVPLIIGFSLASVLTIYLPAYAVRSWLGDGAWSGPYLASLLAIPLQLAGGAEVSLASALLVKGASLGTAVSVLLVAPSTVFSVVRHRHQSINVRTMALYLAAAWLVSGSLGVAVDVVQRLFAG